MAIAIVVVVAGFLPMLLIAALIRLTSPGRALFRQERVGAGGGLFQVLKFRSMTADSGASAGPGLTRDGDARVTPCGKVLRKFKLDEVPQFFNVLKGEMSLVGPRPKLPQFAALKNMPYRPGITGLASLAFRFEDQILASVVPERVESFYQERIKPLKAHLDVCYMCQATPISDLRIVFATFASCMVPASLPRLLGCAEARPRLTSAIVPGDENSGD